MHNNKYYRDVTIDSTALALLPVDGVLPNLQTITVSVTNGDIQNPSQDDEDPYTAHLGSTFVPLST